MDIFERRAHTAIEENAKKLEMLITEQTGYSPVSSLEELELSAEQLKKIQYAKPGGEGVNYYKSQTEDGGEAKALIRALGGRYTAADIFSDAFPGGHGCNNDFLWDELKETLLQGKKRSKN